MSTQPFIISPTTGPWRVATVQGDAPQTRDVPAGTDIASRVSVALRELGYTGQGVVLALPTAWCFAASVDSRDLPRHDRMAMIYRLEEKLPFPAEEFVADFSEAADRSLGVAVRATQIKPIVDLLEAAGVAVQSIVPAALLAARGFDLPATDQPRALLIGSREQIDLIVTQGQCLLGLSSWPNSPEGIRLGLDLAAIDLNIAPEVFTCDVDQPLEGATRIESTAQVAALRAAGELLQGRQRSWIELRHDALAPRDRLRSHRRAIDALLAAAAMLMLAIALACLLRATRYQHSIRAAQTQLAADFQKAFPGWETPASVKAVIQSERRKLASRAADDPGKPASGSSSLRTMQVVLGALPADARFNFDHMTFGESAFDLGGRTISLDGISTLKAAVLRDGWDTAQSQAHRDAEGFWTFAMHGTKESSAVAAREPQK